MIYFKRCGYAESDSKVSHRKVLSAEGRKLLRCALSHKNVPEEKQEIVLGEYGKPMLREDLGLHFNISHCRKLVACVVADKPIGVDVEKICQFPELVLKRCFTEREIEFIKNSPEPDVSFFQLWTLKESYVKAIGKGLSYPFKKAEFIIDNNNIIARTEEGFSFTQIIIDKKYICSVCCDNIFNNRIFYRSFEEEIPFDLIT